MSAGYSGTPLARKLGLRDGMQALLLQVPEAVPEISGFAGFVHVATRLDEVAGRIFDYAHVFETDRATLEAMVPSLRAILKSDGMLWISWPKKASKVPTTITEDVLRTVFLPVGLVDVKVAAVDQVWSGLKFMFRKEVRSTL